MVDMGWRPSTRPDHGPVRLEAARFGPMAVLAVEDAAPVLAYAASRR
jgi:hypothetical protein